MRRASIEKKGAQPKAILIGYARVSTEDQNLELQLSALKKAGCNKVFTDKTSGAGAERAGLKEALSHLRETDTLVVWKLDRLGRSVKGLVDLVIDLQLAKSAGAFQKFDRQHRHEHTGGTVLFHVMASLAQMERELIVERTRAGLESARRQGRVGGRKRLMTERKVNAAKKLLAAGTPPREIAQNLGVSVPTFYRWLPASSKN